MFLQGTFEVEYTSEGDAGLLQRKRLCRKNPSHRGFFPIRTFTQDSLPEGYRTDEMMNLVQRIADLTVRVRVMYTGMNRPMTFLETEKAYSGAELRGCSAMRVGTGFIGNITIEEGEEGQNDCCPCFSCRHSKDPHRIWVQVSVITAAHVICTDDEAVHAELDCFYDDDEDKEIKMKTLYGNSMRACRNSITKVDFADDFCQFLVITHDLDLCQRLNEFKVSDLLTKDLGLKASENMSLTFIVSHPHGCPKCISWGKYTSCDTFHGPDSQEKHRYLYSTPTCPGSSGALVWVLETSQDKWQMVYVHSGGLKNGLSISGSVEMFREYINSLVYCRIS